MALIGDAATDRFFISMAEVRLGPLNEAMALKPEHSVGLLNSATVSFAIESVDLEAGLPRKLYDTQIISQLGTVSMDMREYSRRNMEMLLGYAPQAYTSRVESVLASPANAATENSIEVAPGDGAKFAQGDLIGIYPSLLTDQGNITYAEVNSISPADTLNLGPTALPLQFDYLTGDKVFNTQPIALGANTTTQYFTAQVLGTGRDGTPVGFILWKCALSSGLEVAFQADDFNTNSGEIKILNPSASDVGAGGPLNHVASMISKYPTGISMFSGDLSA